MEVLARVGLFSIVDGIAVNQSTPTEAIAVSHQATITAEGLFHLTEAETGDASYGARV